MAATGTQGSGWRAPEIEVMNRTFHESSRYYPLFGEPRACGLRYVPPPVHENLQSLIKEQMHFERKTPNYLLNGRYTRKDAVSRFGDSRGGRGRALSQVADDARSVASGASGRLSAAGKLAAKDVRKASIPRSEQALADLPV